ncbi:MAG: F0F1 ATP synthase subunit B [Gemmatimonadales bacterium]
MPSVLLFLQEHAAEFNPFSINPGLIFWTLLVFGILFALLWKFAWPPILRSVEERERRIQQQLADAEKARVEAAGLLEEHKKLVSGARAEAMEILNRAKALAEKEREVLIQRARQEQEEILARARREIGDEKAKAIAELRREAVDLAIAAASRVIDANLDSDANRKLVLEYLKDLATGAGSGAGGGSRR